MPSRDHRATPSQPSPISAKAAPNSSPICRCQAAALQDAHLAFHADQAAAGHLLAFGPPAGQDDPTLRGLSIWSVDRDTARQLAEQDPLVQAGRLAVEIASWLTPAGQDDPTLRGLSIWSVDRDTARQLAEQDPLVQAGRLAVEIASWLTPAGQLRFASVRVPRAMAEVAP